MPTPKDYFWNFINGFYLMRQFPVMWFTILMCITVFAGVAIVFTLALLVDIEFLYYGSFALIAIISFFAIKFYSLYRQK